MKLKLVRASWICLWIAALTVAFTAVASAEESWTADQETKCQIGWVSDVYTLVKATWYGSQVNGKAEGKGTLIFTLNDRENGKNLDGRAKCRMKAGKLDGQAQIKYSDDNSYRGFYQNGVKEGQGVYQWSDGRMYDGQWKNGFQDGKGTFTWPKIGYYQGDFQNGQRNGKGVMKYQNGVWYDGDWRDDLRNGQGVLKNKKGQTLYEGPWQGDLLGRPESWATDPKSGCLIGWMADNEILTGVTWSGTSQNGKAEGKGNLALVLITSTGLEMKAKITAELKNGIIDGSINAKYSNGATFEGFYCKGLADGKGVVKTDSNETYDGDWKNGRQEGKGVYRWSNGTVYDGDWKNGLRDGKGAIRYASGDTYSGDWKSGNAEGSGTYRWPNGRIYTGGWRNGVRNGYGVFKDSNGNMIYDGLWKDDQIVSLKVKGSLYL